MTLASSDTGTATNTPIPTKQVSQAQIQALETDIQGWAEGRWDDIQVGQDNGSVIVRAYTDSQVNEVALNGYCKILLESVREHTPNTKFYISLVQGGEIVKSCV